MFNRKKEWRDDRKQKERKRKQQNKERKKDNKPQNYRALPMLIFLWLCPFKIQDYVPLSYLLITKIITILEYDYCCVYKLKN